MNIKKRRTNEQASQMQLQVAMRPKESISTTIKIFVKSSHNFMCSLSPTLVVTPIQAKELKLAMSMLKFIGLKSNDQRARELFFFQRQIQIVKQQRKCQVYRRNYVDEIKERKEQDSGENEIKETLKKYDYSVEKMKRLSRMPIVMVIISKLEEVMTIIDDKEIQIGYIIDKLQKKEANNKSKKKRKRKDKNKVVEHQLVQRPQNKKQKGDNGEIEEIKRSQHSCIVSIFITGLKQEDIECYVKEIYIQYI
ncbi:hypothetical protein RFI_25006 [Reticulomyxa filosa]|uniref:Uncharacterized protein n=1 Tax=Reticulomyxa filosa TaxID=46433 RepID=X6MH66_RETFI|nr:hypothetical protein RFI_25006 [Reticulomyxa filosa]|eukprot:ETO12370.1 hypothetical protein RFI_25006 [Reticulomyxa filosa]